MQGRTRRAAVILVELHIMCVNVSTLPDRALCAQNRHHNQVKASESNFPLLLSRDRSSFTNPNLLMDQEVLLLDLRACFDKDG